MKTKLEVGKEYWLGESKKFKGIYKGGLGNAYYFYITYGDDNFTHDANGFVEFPLHGVFEIEQWQFTTPIAMKCTEEQFNGIKDRLVEMGYKLSAITFCSENRYLSNFIGGANNVITDLVKHRACDRNRTVFEAFNPDLFLALAAMTDKEDGIKGEWWRYTDDMNDPIVPQKRLGEFVVPNKAWRKATAQEIIEHFEKKEFVLPDRWCVKVLTKEQDDAVVAYFNNKYNTGIADFLSCTGWWYYNYAPFVSDGSRKKPDCTEITFDKFKKYVLKETPQSCQKAPVAGSVEYTVNVEFDAEKAAEDLFEKIVELGKSHQPEFKFAWEPCKEKIEKFENFLGSFDPFINIKNTDKTVIPIPPTKQATLFDDRVEITDWKPKDNDEVLVVSINVDGWGFTKTKYKFVAEPYKAHGFIKRAESEAKQLVEKLKQAML